MCRRDKDLMLKLQALINRYGGAKEFVKAMDEWPRTIKELVFKSEPLMIRLGMLMPLPEEESSEPITEDDILAKCKTGFHELIVIMAFGPEVETTAIRWCRVCGAIVGDLQCDNNVNQGAVFKMKLPEISK